MGINKHGTSDNVAGYPKGVKAKLAKVNREQAQRQKNAKQTKNKATNQDGNESDR